MLVCFPFFGLFFLSVTSLVSNQDYSHLRMNRDQRKRWMKWLNKCLIQWGTVSNPLPKTASKFWEDSVTPPECPHVFRCVFYIVAQQIHNTKLFGCLVALFWKIRFQQIIHLGKKGPRGQGPAYHDFTLFSFMLFPSELQDARPAMSRTFCENNTL